LRATWSASVLQDEQKFLRNFNFINERCFAIQVELVCLLTVTYSQLSQFSQKQQSLDKFLVKVARKDSSEPTGDSDSLTAKQ
jgi:hypothetical protein